MSEQIQTQTEGVKPTHDGTQSETPAINPQLLAAALSALNNLSMDSAKEVSQEEKSGEGALAKEEEEDEMIEVEAIPFSSLTTEQQDRLKVLSSKVLEYFDEINADITSSPDTSSASGEPSGKPGNG